MRRDGLARRGSGWSRCRRATLVATACLPLLMGAGSDWPLIGTGEALIKHDGQLVRLKGAYRAFPKSRSKRHEPFDFGHAAVVVGDRWVQLGTLPRPPEERERLIGRTVIARGRLIMHPPLAWPPHVAQPLPPPTLELYGVPAAVPSDREAEPASTAQPGTRAD